MEDVQTIYTSGSWLNEARSTLKRLETERATTVTEYKLKYLEAAEELRKLLTAAERFFDDQGERDSREHRISSQVSQLRQSLRNMTDQRDRLQRDLDSAEDTVSACKEDLEDSKDENRRLKEQLQRKSNVIDGLHLALQDARRGPKPLMLLPPPPPPPPTPPPPTRPPVDVVLWSSFCSTDALERSLVLTRKQYEQQGKKFENVKCALCQETGHIQTFCESRGKLCDKCGTSGHPSAWCPTQECDYCHEAGHQAVVCGKIVLAVVKEALRNNRMIVKMNQRS